MLMFDDNALDDELYANHTMAGYATHLNMSELLQIKVAPMVSNLEGNVLS
jgi:hypothetical protein